LIYSSEDLQGGIPVSFLPLKRSWFIKRNFACMKRFGLSLILCTYIGISTAQTIITPDKRWGNLFKEVQQKRAMGDNKTFVDMVPQGAPASILKKYQLLKNRDSASLRAFVLANFYLPATAEVSVAQGLSLTEHLNQLWNTLTRKADKKTKLQFAASPSSIIHSARRPLPRNLLLGQLLYNAGFSG
jgi:hypothetical protein